MYYVVYRTSSSSKVALSVAVVGLLEIDANLTTSARYITRWAHWDHA